MAHNIPLKEVLVVEHLISLSHAVRILNKFKVKKHAKMGYFFELIDLGMSIHDLDVRKKVPQFLDVKSGCMRIFGDYSGDTQGYHLKVYRTLA